LSQEEFTFESINRASRACGPLVEWVIAQVGYSDILDRVAPLRKQVAELEAAKGCVARVRVRVRHH
jgi:dynein heavy chain 1